jgi:hypothetical protein
MAHFVCYSFGRMNYTPDSYWAGGKGPGAYVMGIEGFGSGQGHSRSPASTCPEVRVWHIFGGSKTINGNSWVAVPMV